MVAALVAAAVVAAVAVAADDSDQYRQQRPFRKAIPQHKSPDACRGSSSLSIDSVGLTPCQLTTSDLGPKRRHRRHRC